MSNILVRTLSGAVFISLVLIPLFLADARYATFVLSAFTLLGTIEFYKLFDKHETIRINWRLNTFFSFLIFGIFVGAALGWFSITAFIFLFPLLFGWMLTELWRKQNHPIANIGVSLLGSLYVGIPMALAIGLHISDVHQFPIVAGMFILIWTNDTFAYLSGRFFGKTKLFERISPKKTWEGTIGGILCTFAMAAGLSILFDPNNLYFWLGSVFFIAPAAIFGDLLESLFKRSLNIKDSGNIMPGHGGILDRFDATLMALPFFAFWLAIYTYFWQNF